MTKQDSTGVEKELLPCPFCGAVAKIHRDAIDGFSVRCPNLGCVMRVETIEHRSESGAAGAWNTRVDDSLRSQVEALRSALEPFAKLATENRPIGETGEYMNCSILTSDLIAAFNAFNGVNKE